MGPQLTVLIIEVSLFQSVHNSRFDCTYYRTHCNRLHNHVQSSNLAISDSALQLIAIYTIA